MLAVPVIKIEMRKLNTLLQTFYLNSAVKGILKLT